MKKVNHQFERFFISISLIIFAAFSLIIGNAAVLLLDIHNKMVITTITALFSLTGFVGIPILIIKYLNYEYSFPKFNLLTCVILSFIIVFLSHQVLHSNEVYHAFFISVSEELLFRNIIYYILLAHFDKKSTIFIGSILFAVLLHLNGDLFINSLVKFPSSIILYWISNKFGIEYSIALHWFYNIFVGSVL